MSQEFSSARLRLECLRLARPDGVMNPDANQIVERAKTFLAFVTADKPEGPAPKPVTRPSTGR